MLVKCKKYLKKVRRAYNIIDRYLTQIIQAQGVQNKKKALIWISLARRNGIKRGWKNLGDI